MSIISVQSVNKEYVKVRWKEPYVSAAINRKTFGVFPKGIYSGFVIGPSGLSDRHIEVGPGSVSGGLGSGLTGGYVSGAFDESVGWSIAVHQNDQGYSSTISIPPGMDQTYTLDANGFDGQRVYIVLDIDYQTGQETTAQILLVDSSEIDANPSYIVIGYCDVPANPINPITIGDFGYNDSNYPRLTPLATPIKAGFMPPSVFEKLDQFFQWENLFKPDIDPNSNYVIQITPSQKKIGQKRIFTFYSEDGASSRFPRDSSGEYNGGVNDDQLTKINISTGAITGAHQVIGNNSILLPPVQGTPDSYQVGLVTVTSEDEIEVSYGSIFSTRADAIKDSNLPAATGFQVCAFVVSTDSLGNVNPMASGDLFDRRPFLNIGGGAGGSVAWKYDYVNNQVGGTVTFNKTYGYGKGTLFFRNGAKMHKVSSFTSGDGSYAHEYQEIDLGNNSLQISLNPYGSVSGEFHAVSGEEFEMLFLQNTYNSQGLSEKLIQISRGYADGSQVQNCTISTVSSKTRVKLGAGFNFVENYNSGKTKGDLTVRVNGTDIERLVAGKNNNTGNTVYEEVTSDTIDIYVVGMSPSPLVSTDQVEVEKISYFVSDLEAITGNLIPAVSGVYDLGAPGLSWRDLYISGTSIHIGDGTIRRNPSSGKLEYRKDGSSSFGPVAGLDQEEINSPQTLTVGKEYIVNAASKLALTLPASPQSGDKISIIGKGTGGWRIFIPSGQSIYLNSGSPVQGGTQYYVDSLDANASAELIYVGGNLWVVSNSHGPILAKSNYWGDGSDGDLSTSGNVNLTSVTDSDVVVKHYKSLVINNGHTMTVANRCKGLVIYVDGDCTINGTLTMTARGAFSDPVAAGVSASGIRLARRKSGSTDSLSASDVSGCGSSFISSEANQFGISSNGKIYTVARSGGAGGDCIGGSDAGIGWNSSGGPGGTASNGSGGGGAGGALGANAVFVDGGSGAAGTCFSGGGGGGGVASNVLGSYYGGNAAANGGAGGNGTATAGYGAGAGSGNPGGNPGGTSTGTANGTGGLMILIVRGNLTIGASGVISSNGVTRGTTGTNHALGGSSGGGRVIALYGGTLNNSGTIQANGGSGYTGGGGNGTGSDGGAGGAGSVTIDKVDI